MSAVAYLRLLSETVPVPLLHTASTAVDVAQQGTLPPRPPRTHARKRAGFRISSRQLTRDLMHGLLVGRPGTRARAPARTSSQLLVDFCSSERASVISARACAMEREIGRDRSTAPEAKLLRGIASV